MVDERNGKVEVVREEIKERGGAKKQRKPETG